MTNRDEHTVIGAPTGEGKAAMTNRMPRPQLPFEYPPMIGQKAARYDFIMGWLRGQIADEEETVDANAITAMFRDARNLYPIRGEYVG